MKTRHILFIAACISLWIVFGCQKKEPIHICSHLRPYDPNADCIYPAEAVAGSYNVTETLTGERPGGGLYSYHRSYEMTVEAIGLYAIRVLGFAGCDTLQGDTWKHSFLIYADSVCLYPGANLSAGDRGWEFEYQILNLAPAGTVRGIAIHQDN